ncbi:thiamine phosphate synthase [Roseococcus sp. SDR]|uniref:thiamine phosphate synthase n=1 Tax=Roseococcus sp. SDR TaxID=2835532 RepID=UPI001BCD76D0|nr:thiamine phosphate synthase [Roseococcus sp. SDR]MBS7792100.1 thiamine phosphate synthase [Roseococcus sp. SDR]MBV1847414.1 thiamine phosphate synthase [Roseococcus sp. SDR]
MRHRIGRGRRGAILPRRWLLSDPIRLPDPSPLLGGLPRGTAVLLRSAAPEVAVRVARLCRERGFPVLVSGDGRLALRIGAGLHVPDRAATRGLLPFLLNRRGALLSAAVHGRAGVARAGRLDADVVLVSPVFPTASHPGAPALGPLRWAALARAARAAVGCHAVALGGMSAGAMRRLPRGLAAGWAGIGVWKDCVLRDTVSQGSRVWL